MIVILIASDIGVQLARNYGILSSKLNKKFKANILALVRPPSKSIFDIPDPLVIKWLYHLRIGLSHLHDHKVKHNFSDTLSDKCVLCHCIFSYIARVRFIETQRPLEN